MNTSVVTNKKNEVLKFQLTIYNKNMHIVIYIKYILHYEFLKLLEFKKKIQ